MAYFFANQGSSIEILREQGYLFTTPSDRVTRQTANFQMLSDMRVGDVVVINYGGLVGVATVSAKGRPAPMAANFAAATNAWDSQHGQSDSYWKAGMDGIRVDVRFEPLSERVRYQDYKAKLLEAQAATASTRKPFDSNGNANQGTFYWLDSPLARVLMDLVGRPLPATQPFHTAPSKDEAPSPYVARFGQREVRAEQDAFRERMIEVWGKCPITRIKNPALLDAAHLVGFNWRHHNGDEAGILLSPLIHRAVDRQVIELKLDARRTTWRVTVLVRGDDAIDGLDRFEFRNPLIER